MSEPVKSNSAGIPSLVETRCEACEYEAAEFAYAAELGASEWEAFIHQVPVCDDCREIRKRLGVSV